MLNKNTLDCYMKNLSFQYNANDYFAQNTAQVHNSMLQANTNKLNCSHKISCKKISKSEVP